MLHWQLLGKRLFVWLFPVTPQQKHHETSTERSLQGKKKETTNILFADGVAWIKYCTTDYSTSIISGSKTLNCMYSNILYQQQCRVYVTKSLKGL